MLVFLTIIPVFVNTDFIMQICNWDLNTFSKQKYDYDDLQDHIASQEREIKQLRNKIRENAYRYLSGSYKRLHTYSHCQIGCTSIMFSDEFVLFWPIPLVLDFWKNVPLKLPLPFLCLHRVTLNLIVFQAFKFTIRSWTNLFPHHRERNST